MTIHFVPPANIVYSIRAGILTNFFVNFTKHCISNDNILKVETKFKIFTVAQPSDLTVREKISCRVWGGGGFKVPTPPSPDFKCWLTVWKPGQKHKKGCSHTLHNIWRNPLHLHIFWQTLPALLPCNPLHIWMHHSCPKHGISGSKTHKWLVNKI